MSEIPIGRQAPYPITTQDRKQAHTPDLAEFMSLRLREFKAEINCCQVGTIQSFDETTQTASVSINIFRVVENKTSRYPVLVNVPVLVSGGAGGQVTIPITAGDPCIVLFCDRNIDAWALNGIEAAPASERMHDLSDGIAIVGVRPFTNPLSNYSQDGPEVRKGGTSIKALSAGVKLYGGSTDWKLTLMARIAADLIKALADYTQSVALQAVFTALASDTALSSTTRAACSAAADAMGVKATADTAYHGSIEVMESATDKVFTS